MGANRQLQFCAAKCAMRRLPVCYGNSPFDAVVRRLWNYLTPRNDGYISSRNSLPARLFKINKFTIDTTRNGSSVWFTDARKMPKHIHGYKQQLYENPPANCHINFSRSLNYNLWQAKFIYHIAKESGALALALSMNN